MEQQVFIRNYELPLVLGVHKHERQRRQKITVSLQADVNFAEAAKKDSLQGTLNYEQLHEDIGQLGKNNYYTLEAFVWAIAQLALQNKNVEKVWVEAKKNDVLPYAKEVGVSLCLAK